MENLSKSCFSEDFVEQILLGLPPKSLMRFKCVSKLWCKLFKSPTFVAKHLSRMRTLSKHVLFKRPIRKDMDNYNIKDGQKCDNDDDNVEFLLSSLNICNEDDDYLKSTVVEDLNVPLPTAFKLKRRSYLRITGHCDGIICLNLFLGDVILCNPALKEFKLLPKSFLLLPNDEIDLESLQFEVRYHTEHLGFGYDPKGNDYKVVRFVTFEEAWYSFSAEVYTMDSNSWKEIKTKYNDMAFVSWSSDLPMYLNGFCYWHAIGYHIECGDFILSFDMGNEIFGEIMTPYFPDDGYRVVTLTMWNEFVALLSCQEETEGQESYDMWLMVEDTVDGKSSWRKHSTIRILEGIVEGNISPLLFWKSNQLLIVTINDGHIALYNTETHILKYLPIHFMEELICSQAICYVNSIVSINGGCVLEDLSVSAFYGSGKLFTEHGKNYNSPHAFSGHDD